MRLPATALLAFAAMASCSASYLRTEHDEAIHRQSWRTYAFAEGARSEGAAWLRNRLAEALEAGLAARGLSLCRESPELLVRAGFSTIETTEVSPFGHASRARPTPEQGLTLRPTRKVLLTVEILDAARPAGALWRGEAEDHLDVVDNDRDWVDRTVAALLSSFPDN